MSLSRIAQLMEESEREKRLRLRVTLLARLALGVVYIGALITLGAPPWAFVLALISATYWGPPQ